MATARAGSSPDAQAMLPAVCWSLSGVGPQGRPSAVYQLPARTSDGAPRSLVDGGDDASAFGVPIVAFSV